MEYLDFANLLNTGNLLAAIIEQQWPKLKLLKIRRTGRIDSLKLS
jgi:hypothetical protein